MLSSGQYDIALTTGIRRFTGVAFAGSSVTQHLKVVIVNSSASPITGRVLVQYDPRLMSLEEIRSAIETIGQPQRAPAPTQLQETCALTLVRP